jgi:hypothetical protein
MNTDAMAYELQKEIIKTVITFLKEHDKQHEVDEVNFSVDCLSPSLEAGQWHPGTDSSLSLYNEDGTRIGYSI